MKVWVVLDDQGTTAVSEPRVVEVLDYKPDEVEMMKKYGRYTEIEEWEVGSK